MRQHAQKRRAEETTEEIEVRRVSSRRYRQGRRNVERNQHVTTEASAAIFASKIAEGPIYACCSCYRLLYKTCEKYLSTKPIERILNSCTVVKTHGKSWLCSTCHNALKKGKIPTQSWANGLTLDGILPELKDLRPLESRLISQRIPFMKLVGLPRGGQKAIHGSAVNVPCKLQQVTSLLPRLPNSAEVVAVKLKRKLAYKGHYMYEYVRPKLVMDALRWLQENNQLYNDINVCEDWET